MKLRWMSEFSCEEYHKKHIFKHYLKFSISNSINSPWGSKRYALNTVAKLFKGSLAHWPSQKLVREFQMREVFSSFYFPHFIGNLRWEVSKEASLRLTNPPNWWACHEWWKKPIHLAFLDYCHPSGPRPIGNGLGSTPDLVGSWVTGSLLARKRVIASNRSVGFLLLIQLTASSRHFDRQSNSFTPLLTAALHQDEANVDLL